MKMESNNTIIGRLRFQFGIGNGTDNISKKQTCVIVVHTLCNEVALHFREPNTMLVL